MPSLEYQLRSINCFISYFREICLIKPSRCGMLGNVGAFGERMNDVTVVLELSNDNINYFLFVSEGRREKGRKIDSINILVSVECSLGQAWGIFRSVETLSSIHCSFFTIFDKIHYHPTWLTTIIISPLISIYASNVTNVVLRDSVKISCHFCARESSS